jgi:hypothetical protein
VGRSTLQAQVDMAMRCTIILQLPSTLRNVLTAFGEQRASQALNSGTVAFHVGNMEDMWTQAVNIK